MADGPDVDAVVEEALDSLDIDASVVVLLYNAFYQCKSESPASSFGCVTWVEYRFEAIAGDTFTGILDVDVISGVVVR